MEVCGTATVCEAVAVQTVVDNNINKEKIKCNCISLSEEYRLETGF